MMSHDVTYSDPHTTLYVYIVWMFSSAGTIRRFLEHYGDTIEVVVFVADAEDVSTTVCGGVV